MAEPTYLVAFCCNDDGGAFRGRCEALRVDDAGGRLLLSVEGYFDRSPAMRLEGRVVFVSGKAFATAGEWQHPYVHRCWDAVPMALSEARRLVELLLSRKFTVDQYVIGGPFEDIGERAVKETARG